jgi:hypothetical protein
MPRNWDVNVTHGWKLALAHRVLHLDLDEAFQLDGVRDAQLVSASRRSRSLSLQPRRPLPFEAGLDSSRATSKLGRRNQHRSLPVRRTSPAHRTLFASVPHLARVRWRVDAVGPRPASLHAGPVQPSYSLTDDPAKPFRPGPRSAVPGLGEGRHRRERSTPEDCRRAQRRVGCEPAELTDRLDAADTTPIDRRRPTRRRRVFPWQRSRNAW